MSDQSQPAPQSTESSDSTSQAQIAEPLSTVPQQPSAEQNLSKTEQKLEKVERDMSGFERSTLRWTRATFIILAVTCLFIGYQGYEIRKGSVDTHTLAEAAQTQARKLGDMSTAADRIQQAATNMVTQEQRIADNAQKALDSSNAQSQRVLTANIDAAHLEQRAWVGDIAVEMDAIESGKVVSGYVTWYNSGKTFAKKVRPVCHYFSLPKPVPDEQSLMNLVVAVPGLQSIGVLTPGAQYKTILKGSEPIPQLEADTMAKYSWYTYVWGEVTYEDIFGKSHMTSFCDSRQGTSGDFIQCPFHNDAN